MTRFHLIAPLTIALALASAVPGAAAQTVYRCEGRDGHVTYSDEPCPTTARTVRRVDDSPPVQVQPGKAGEPGQDAKPVRSGAAPMLLHATHSTSSNPEAEFQRLEDERLRQGRACQDLARRIAYARSDLASATGAQRASAELTLRRLQEEQRLACPRG